MKCRVGKGKCIQLYSALIGYPLGTKLDEAKLEASTKSKRERRAEACKREGVKEERKTGRRRAENERRAVDINTQGSQPCSYKRIKIVRL